MLQQRQYNILLIEDNPADIRLTKEAFRESNKDIQLEVVTDGREALLFLNQSPPYESKKLPDLILLDLNLPKQNGQEVLTVIKQDKRLRRIPVIVLTTSKAENDILKCYDLHANAFINKPIDFDNFFDIVHKIEEFWLSTVILASEVT
jgi:CheY-like chemotaxis protein